MPPFFCYMHGNATFIQFVMFSILGLPYLFFFILRGGGVFFPSPFPILKNYTNWFEVIAEVFEHYFSIWHVAGLLDLCTNFCWAVYNPYYIIHAETCINWQDVEVHAIYSQYFSFLTIGTSLYEQVRIILTPVSANHLWAITCQKTML